MVIALIRGVDDENWGRQYAEDGQNAVVVRECIERYFHEKKNNRGLGNYYCNMCSNIWNMAEWKEKRSKYTGEASPTYCWRFH